MKMSREQSFRSLTETKDAGHLVTVFAYKGREWVDHYYGVVTRLSEDAIVLRCRADGREVSLNLRNVVLDTNALGFETYQKKWRLRGSDGSSWNILDCESDALPLLPL